MSVLVIYQPESEHARSVIEFLHDFEQRTHKKIEEIDAGSRRGIELCELYDVVEYPTVVALAQDGQLRSSWRGVPLPLIDEVDYYVQ